MQRKHVAEKKTPSMARGLLGKRSSKQQEGGKGDEHDVPPAPAKKQVVNKKFEHPTDDEINMIT